MRIDIKRGLICCTWASKPLKIMISSFKMTRVFNKFSETCGKQNVFFKEKAGVSSHMVIFVPTRKGSLSSCELGIKREATKCDVISSSEYFLFLKKNTNCIYPFLELLITTCFSPYFLLYYFILWYNYKSKYVQPAGNLSFDVRIRSSWLLKFKVLLLLPRKILGSELQYIFKDQVLKTYQAKIIIKNCCLSSNIFLYI